MIIHGHELQMLARVCQSHSSPSPLIEDRFSVVDLPWAIDPTFGMNQTILNEYKKISITNENVSIRVENINGMDCYVVNDIAVVSTEPGSDIPDRFYSANPILNILISSLRQAVTRIAAFTPVQTFCEPPLMERPVFTDIHWDGKLYQSPVTVFSGNWTYHVKAIAAFCGNGEDIGLLVVFTMNGFTVGNVSMKYVMKDGKLVMEEMIITDDIIGIQEKMGAGVTINDTLKSATPTALMFNTWSKMPLTEEE